MVTLVLENLESFDIPKKYIKKRKIINGKPKSIWIDKSYLDVCDQHIWFTWEGRTKEDVQQRLLNTHDITQVIVKNKTFMVNFIDDYFDRLGADNILQTIIVTNNLIKIEWDINPKNNISGNYYIPKLKLHKKYKNIKVYGYDKINYFK